MSAYSDATINKNFDDKIEKKIFGKMVSDKCEGGGEKGCLV